jgi:hypothetical protein
MDIKSMDQVFKDKQDFLLSIPGVQGFYQGATEKGEDLIVVMVDKLTAENKKLIPDSLEGYPVRIEEVGKIKPLDKKKTSPGE